MGASDDDVEDVVDVEDELVLLLAMTAGPLPLSAVRPTGRGSLDWDADVDADPATDRSTSATLEEDVDKDVDADAGAEPAAGPGSALLSLGSSRPVEVTSADRDVVGAGGSATPEDEDGPALIGRFAVEEAEEVDEAAEDERECG